MAGLSERQAAEQLTRSLLAMGEAGSSPVLQVLDDPDTIIQGRKYPPGNLRFADQGIQAYYHSHAEPYTRDDEHGHFHVFLRLPDPQEQTWSHLVALSVDAQGQPQKWMMVNRWVTGTCWGWADTLDAAMAALPAMPRSGFSLVENWLHSLLILYHSQLAALLEKRDQRIHELTVDRDTEAVFEDRSIYVLCEAPVDLLTDLSPLFA